MLQVWNAWSDGATDSRCATGTLPLLELLAAATAQCSSDAAAAAWHERRLPLAIEPGVEESAATGSCERDNAVLHLAFR